MSRNRSTCSERRHIPTDGDVTVAEAQRALDELSAIAEAMEREKLRSEVVESAGPAKREMTLEEKKRRRNRRAYERFKERRKEERKAREALKWDLGKELDWVYRNFREPGITPAAAPTLSAGAWLEYALEHSGRFLKEYKAEVDRRKREAGGSKEDRVVMEWTAEQVRLIERDLREIGEKVRAG